MNKAIANEMQVSIQYMWQHVQWGGIKHYAVTDELKKIAIAEMKHAEKIADRLWYLGGKPTTSPSPITVGENIWNMAEVDAKAEQDTIVLYKEIVKVADEEGDVTTRVIFEGILKEEEEHHDFFISVLEDNESNKKA